MENKTATGRMQSNAEVIDLLLKCTGWKSLSDFSGKQVLELGCSDGNLFPFFERLGSTIEGIDNDFEAIERGQSKGRRTLYGDIDDPDGSIGSIRGRMSNAPAFYDLAFSHDVWTPSATAEIKTIKNFLRVPSMYLKSGGCLVHVVNTYKGLCNYTSQMNVPELESLGIFSSETKRAIAWRKK